MALGKDAFWQIEKETTYGTAIAARCKSELESEDLQIDVDDIEDTSLYAGRTARAFYQGGVRFTGPVSVRLNYEGIILKLLEGALWSASSALVGGETYVRDHTIKEGATAPSYTIEMSKANVPSAKVIRGLGAAVKSLTMRGGVGDESLCHAEAEFLGTDLDPNTGTTPAGYDPTLSFTVASCTLSGSSAVVTTSNDFLTSGVKVGQAVTGTGVTAGSFVGRITSATSITLVDASGAPLNITTPGTVTLTFTLGYPFIWPVLGKHVVTLNNGVTSVTYPGGALRVRSWEVKIDNPLAERFYLGAANTDLPLPDSRTQVTWTFEEEYQDLKAFQAARLFTDTAPKIIFQDPTTLGSAVKREFELRSNKARCKYSNPINKYGVILATSTHRAYYDTVDASAIVARVRNSDGNV